MAQIKFWRGTQAQYTAIAGNIDAYTLYFITDANKIYLNGQIVASNDAALISTEVGAIDDKLTAAIAKEVSDRNTAIATEVGKETSARETAISELDTAYKAADLALDGKITTEKEARIAADNVLDGKISTEATARADADTALGGRIDNVITAYEAADTALGKRIDGVLNDKIGNLGSDASVSDAIKRLDAKDVQLDSKISELVLSGGAMVYVGVLAKEGDFATFAAASKVNRGSTFTVNYDGSFYGNAVEIGDMVIYVSDNKGANPAKADFVVVQANLSAAVQSASPALTADNLVLGSGGKDVKISDVTVTSLKGAIAKASDAILKSDTNNQAIAGTLTAAGFIGDVTGNVSGSAVSLKNARNFSITGGATAAAVSFNGTGAVELNVTALDTSKLGNQAFPVDTYASTSKYGVVKIATALSNQSNDVVTSSMVKGAIDTINGDITTANGEITKLKTAVGAEGDAASATGSIYARIKKLSEDVSGNTTAISALGVRLGSAEGNITQNASNITAVSDRVTVTEGLLSWIIPASK